MMQALQNFRDSGRISRSSTAATLPTSGRTAPPPPIGGPQTGDDVVSALVFKLYARQRESREMLLEQQKREQQLQQKRKTSGLSSAIPKRIPSSLVVGCVTVDFSDDEGSAGVVSDEEEEEEEEENENDDGGGDGADRWEVEATAVVRELRDARSRYPSEVEFYLPQLCIVVALGDFARPVPLVDFLLELCESDLRLAHKTHWFLKAFCAGSRDPAKPDPVGLSAFARCVQHRGCMVASRLSKALTHRQQQELEQLRQGVRQPWEMPLLSALVTPAHRSDEDPSFASVGRPTATTGGTPQGEVSGASNTEPDDVVIRSGNDQEASRLEGPPTVAGKPMTGAKSGERLPSSPLPSSVGVAVVTAACNEASAFDGELGGSGLSPTPAEAVKQGVGEVVGDRGGDGASENALHERGLVTRVWRESDGGDANDGGASGGQASVRRGWGGEAGGGEGAGDGEEGEEEEDESLAEHYDPAMFFVEALLGLAEQLGDISSKKRAKGLQDGLEKINEFFLSDRAQGSDLIYVPFGGGFHQIRAIHQRESMHFSTKERVPLLVCLEVQEVSVPRNLARSARSASASASIAGDEDTLALAVDGSRGGGVISGGAGEAGLMDRYLGTVRSFVKLPSGAEGPDCEGTDAEETMKTNHESDAGGRQQRGQNSVPTKKDQPLIRLEDSIPGDDCSSRTGSDPELVTMAIDDLTLGGGKGMASDAGAGGGGGGTTATDGDTEYAGEDGVGFLRYGDGDGDDGDGGGGGAGSQGGFWYGEGGGASALEAAMGQWGDDLINPDSGSGLERDVVDRRDTETDDDSSAHGMLLLPQENSENVTLGDCATAGGGGGRRRIARDNAAAATAGAGGLLVGAGVGEDESWEIIDAPGHWEEGLKDTSSGGKSDSQSDSYSEYLAAVEAERLDRQLAAEAEEEEAREAEALAHGTSGGGGAGTGAVGGEGRYRSASPDRGGGLAGARSGGGSGRTKSGRRRRLEAIRGEAGGGGCGSVAGKAQDQQQGQQPRIIFKERWREKEARVWQERSAAAVWQEGGDRLGLGARALAAVISADVDDGVASAAAGTRLGRGGGVLPLAPGWKLLPIIVKANDDLRQEQFVSQLVGVFDKIFNSANLGARLRPYEIMATSPRAGLIEAVPDTVSLDALKRHAPHLPLHEFFRRHFGRRGMLRQARSNFVESCAAYSVVCYLLQIKDRHNGNLLLSADGHLIHIDWGFALDLSPGGNLGFESAPFKLTQDFVEVMGGARSTSFQRYRSLCVRAFLEARRSREKIITLVEMMVAFRPDLACFGGRPPDAVLKHLRARFQPDLSAEKCVSFVGELIEQSVDNWRTRWFDKYQKAFVGIQ